MTSRDIYYAWASNDDGATTDILGSRGHSKTAAIKEARRQMGSGWTIHIVHVGVDGDGQSTFEPVEIQKFRIR